MSENHVQRKLSRAEYVEWLRAYVDVMNGFADFVAKDGQAAAKTIVPFLRVAEHSFNFFLAQKSTYESLVEPESTEPPDVSLAPVIGQLKFDRDRLADKVATMIEGDPALKARFKEFCDHLKDPRSLGCML